MMDGVVRRGNHITSPTAELPLWVLLSKRSSFPLFSCVCYDAACANDLRVQSTASSMRAASCSACVLGGPPYSHHQRSDFQPADDEQGSCFDDEHGQG